MSRPFLLHTGDALDVLKTLSDNSVDSVVTDPPYGLSEGLDVMAMLRAWLAGETHEHGKAGFMGRKWDSTTPGPDLWREVYRVRKPKHRVDHAPGARDHVKDDIVQHPTQKPLALIRILVRLLSPPGGTVLDPFMGSGTTGVAVVDQEFQFIGINLEPLYREIALLRLGDEERIDKQTEALVQQSLEENPGGILAMFGGDE